MNILEERAERRRKREEQYRWHLIKARQDSGLTLREISSKTFYCPAQIVAAERGRAFPKDGSVSSLNFFQVMENFYGVPREILRKRGFIE